MIASALAQASDVLLLDEPTASLDLGYQLEIAPLLGRLNRERGVTMVVSTHDLNLAAALCTGLVLLSGRTRARRRPTRDGAHARATSAPCTASTRTSVDHPRAGHLTVVPLARSGT